MGKYVKKVKWHYPFSISILQIFKKKSRSRLAKFMVLPYCKTAIRVYHYMEKSGSQYCSRVVFLHDNTSFFSPHLYCVPWESFFVLRKPLTGLFLFLPPK